jgi:uncharacterized protein (TIGR02271 family)
MPRQTKDDGRAAPEPRSRPDELAGESLVRHEQKLEVGKRLEEIGAVRARKVLETERVERSIPLEHEIVELERLPADANDSGRVEELPDGSISIPVFGEEIEVRKRVVVKERVRLAKRTITDEETVATNLARERIHIDADPHVDVRELAPEQAEPTGEEPVG